MTWPSKGLLSSYPGIELTIIATGHCNCGPSFRSLKGRCTDSMLSVSITLAIENLLEKVRDPTSLSG